MILVQCAVVGGKNVCPNWVVTKHLSCDRLIAFSAESSKTNASSDLEARPTEAKCAVVRT